MYKSMWAGILIHIATSMVIQPFIYIIKANFTFFSSVARVPFKGQKQYIELQMGFSKYKGAIDGPGLDGQ